VTSRRDPVVELRGISKRFGPEVAVDAVSLAVQPGEFVTLLGPSGCGKTTTLRCIAGLERPDAGEIRIGGELVASAPRGLHLNPEARNIGMVFQSYAVWPHMTVFDNVAYGLRVRRLGRARVAERTRRALDLVGLGPLAGRYATRLSGGQRQRVALARALAYEPRVILFDEPLSNLDAKLREQMRIELVRLQKETGITSIYVTHDQTEALVMSDRVVVMDRGVIQQVGDPRTIYAQPANAFVASFLGVANLLPGRLLGRTGGLCDLEVAVGDGRPPLRLRTAGGDGVLPDQRVVLTVRPEDLALSRHRPGAGALNVIEGEVVDTVYLGSFLDCRVRVGPHEMDVQIDHDEELAPGQTVFLSFEPEHALCLTR